MCAAQNATVCPNNATLHYLLLHLPATPAPAAPASESLNFLIRIRARYLTLIAFTLLLHTSCYLAQLRSTGAPSRPTAARALAAVALAALAAALLAVIAAPDAAPFSAWALQGRLQQSLLCQSLALLSGALPPWLRFVCVFLFANSGASVIQLNQLRLCYLALLRLAGLEPAVFELALGGLSSLLRLKLAIVFFSLLSDVSALHVALLAFLPDLLLLASTLALLLRERALGGAPPRRRLQGTKRALNSAALGLFAAAVGAGVLRGAFSELQALAVLLCWSAELCAGEVVDEIEGLLRQTPPVRLFWAHFSEEGLSLERISEGTELGIALASLAVGFIPWDLLL